MSLRPRIAGVAVAAAIAAGIAPGCSLGEGEGTVSGTLDVPDCWSGVFDLKPDFFAAVPSSTAANGGGSPNAGTSDALLLRIQNGGDFESFSDGLAILIDDAGEVRGDPAADGTPRPSLLGKNLVVSLPDGVEPSGVPIAPVPNPGIVHATLYLEKTCRTQNVALYALSAVTLNPDGTCNRPDSGDAPLPCDGPAEVSVPDGGIPTVIPPDGGADAGVTGRIAASFINFTSLFDGNPDESNAQKRLTSATFHFYLADPREICPGGVGPPPRCRGDLTGNFSFYFERGQPAQPFP
jgi:hypothetical protein